MPFAFIARGVVLNVLKEELPKERESRLWPFVGADAAYRVLLLTVQEPSSSDARTTTDMPGRRRSNPS